ncbi:MAG: glycosyltransferase [Gemmatimonadota bacterium]|nr:glycosyltransferase [Gemmatimonadota bacterium]
MSALGAGDGNAVTARVGSSPDVPGITVVVPTHDRHDRLIECLDALVAQTYPSEKTQVIVVDDGSPSPARPVLDRFVKSHGFEIVEQENLGPAAARNAGAALATHGWVAFTDDDCRPDPMWLARLAAAAREHPTAMLGGPIRNALSDNLCAEASQQLVSYLYEYFADADGAGRFLTSNNLAVPVDGFRELGGFSEAFPLAAAEDRDFCHRWARSGRSIVYVPGARVDHGHALRLSSYWRQHVGYGRGAHRYHSRRAQRGEGNLRVEPVRFYTGMLRYPFRTGVRKPAAVSTLIALAQVANALGYFAEAARSRRSSGGERRPA